MFTVRMLFGGGRARAAREAEAREAAGRAATAFVALDAEQREVAGLVDMIAGLRTDPVGAELRTAWERAAAQCDDASRRYLAALENPAVADPTTNPVAGRDAFAAATAHLERARTDLRAFSDRCRLALADTETALAALTERANAADAAVADARAAILEAEEAGVRPTRAITAMERVDAAHQRVREGAIRHGISGVHRALDDLDAAVANVQRRAHESVAARGGVHKALPSLRTRIDAITNKLPRADEGLRDLRRGFSGACWEDLQAIPAAAAGALAVATDEHRALQRIVDGAAGSGTAVDWDAAGATVQRTREQLAAVEQQLDTIHARLADLRAVQQDPKAEHNRTRFAIRDAQRLVLRLPDDVMQRYAKVLDAQSNRLDRAPGRLTGTHPNYWAYLEELRSIRTRVTELVAQVRADMSRAG